MQPIIILKFVVDTSYKAEKHHKKIDPTPSWYGL